MKDKAQVLCCIISTIYKHKGEKIMKKALVILLTCAFMAAAVACGGGNNQTAAPAAEAPAETEAEEQPEAEAPAEEAVEETEEVEMNVPEEAMSYEDYMAAPIDGEVVVKGAIQAKQTLYHNEEDESITTNVYLQDANGGAYFLYHLPCTPKDYDMMEVGKFIKVKGYKAQWPAEDGEIEVVDTIWQFEDDEPFIAEAEDVTELLGTEDLVKKQNKFVVFKGMKVEPIGEDGDAFLYNWDGSGEEGSDLYFNVSVNGATYNFTVESDLCGPDTDVYKAVKDLKVGDVIDLQGFLYWYEGPNPHITAVLAQ